jgi:hypothetical protein
MISRLPFALALMILAAPAAQSADSQADPAATKLLADARAARANWVGFPGFTADLEVNIDGHTGRARVEVKPDGKLSLDTAGGALDKGAENWVRHELGSVVGHRLDSGTDLETPCAFADGELDHPLGRAVRVLNDEFHSSYRIRDRQIVVVNRNMPQQGVRFTITVLENRLNEEKKYLPVSYVVNSWDLKADTLTSSEAHHQSWRRVGKFDLPETVTVVTAKADKQEARSLELSNFKLLP